ncbi:hypothetical protein HDE_08318 [Halotydeus destructor]|nr:hypothetical protein HDE_08318 [Halotydeus destructor]
MFPSVSSAATKANRSSESALTTSGLRRKRQLAEELTSPSTRSVVNSMNKFIRAVNDMNGTVLITTKLQDMEMDTANDQTIDLMSLHSMLVSIKNELLYSRLEDEGQAVALPVATADSKDSVNSSSLPLAKKSGPASSKTPTDDGYTSLTSFSRSTSDDDSSDADSDFYNRSENSSKAELDGANSDQPQCLVNLFRFHLDGLQSALNRFTEYADQITSSYAAASA